MNRFQLEKLYEVNGLKDYKLKTTDDLLKTHGLDFKEVAGYTRLDDLNKLLYEKFIVNFLKWSWVGLKNDHDPQRNLFC